MRYLEICSRLDHQIEIMNFVQRLKDNGVLYRFVNPEKVQKFLREVKREGVFMPEINPKLDDWAVHFTVQVAKIMEQFSQNGEEKTCKEVMHFLESSEGIAKLYIIMFNYSTPIYMEFANSLIEHFDFEEDAIFSMSRTIEELQLLLKTHYDKKLRCMELIEGLIPDYVSSVPAKCEDWVNKNKREFEKIDISERFEAIPFETYYSFLFRGVKSVDNVENIDASDFMLFESAKETKKRTEVFFKKLMLDIIFEETNGKSGITSNFVKKRIEEIFETNSILAHIVYVQALGKIYSEEARRVQAQLEEYLKANGIKHENRYTNPFDQCIAEKRRCAISVANNNFYSGANILS